MSAATCFTCPAQATRVVTVEDAAGAVVLRMETCEDCEPRHIPQGEVAMIRSMPLTAPAPANSDTAGRSKGDRR